MVPLAARNAYCNDRLHSRILDRKGVNAMPFRRWKRSDSLTQEDGFLVGAIIGLMLGKRALSIQALSKGYQRFTQLGSSCAGGSAGSLMAAFTYSLRHPERSKDHLAKSRVRDEIEEDRLKALNQLSQNETFMESLSPWVRNHSSIVRFWTKHLKNAPCAVELAGLFPPSYTSDTHRTDRQREECPNATLSRRHRTTRP